MHEDCDTVHTGVCIALRIGLYQTKLTPLDIKGDNIFMSGVPPPIYPSTVHLQHNDLMSATFKLGDMGSGMCKFPGD